MRDKSEERCLYLERKEVSSYSVKCREKIRIIQKGRVIRSPNSKADRMAEITSRAVE